MNLTRAALIPAVATLAACIHTDSLASHGEEVLRLEAAFRAAQLAKDEGALARLLPADYVHIHAGDGKVSTRDEYVAYVAGPALTYTSAEASNLMLRHYGNVVVVLSDVAVTGFSRGNRIAGPGGGPFRFRSTRTYMKRNGRWEPIFGQATAR